MPLDEYIRHCRYYATLWLLAYASILMVEAWLLDTLLHGCHYVTAEKMPRIACHWILAPAAATHTLHTLRQMPRQGQLTLRHAAEYHWYRYEIRQRRHGPRLLALHMAY